MSVVNKKDILDLLAVAKVDSIKALSFFHKCSNKFYYPPEVIIEVINLIKKDSLKESLIIIKDFQDHETKQNALFNLALHVQTYNLSFALQIANLCVPYYKSRLLARISYKVLKSDIEVETIIANSIDESSYKTGALTAIASYTHDEGMIDKVIKNVKTVKTPKFYNFNDDNCEVLTNIASSIAENFPYIAIDLLNDIYINKPIAIESVAMNLTDTDLAIKLIKTSIVDDGIPWLSSALRVMALKIAKTDTQKALTLIDEIEDQYEKEDALFWFHQIP
ncbi:MAG: hypothetical protein U9R39_00820 [Campylobacterota bacterium]|nr:hypothetical protein [Campylobacterota bacterium]